MDGPLSSSAAGSMYTSYWMGSLASRLMLMFVSRMDTMLVSATPLTTHCCTGWSRFSMLTVMPEQPPSMKIAAAWP